jgi:putative MFS transporter
MSGISGTVLGSWLWGSLGDRIGRRSSILFAGILFVSTSICGTMPGFGWNLFMCFMMGLAAGGLLPVAIALLSELLPVRHRAAAIVLLGGIGAVGGYLAASGSSTLWVPTYSWRILWFLNLPTGLLLLLLNRYIPESPRYLLSQGRVEEAQRILHDFGAGTLQKLRGRREPQGTEPRVGMENLFKPPYIGQTAAVVLYGLSWGLVNYGFFLWLPSNLLASGFTVQSASALLAKSAIYALPGVAVAAWLYSRWSSRRTIVLVSAVTAAALLAFIPLSGTAHQQPILLTILVLALLIATAAMTSTLSPYSTEIYPTRARASGAGIAAGAGKVGGIVGIAAVLAKVTPTLETSALLVAIPVVVATIVLGLKAIETRGRGLEDVSAAVAQPRELATAGGKDH